MPAVKISLGGIKMQKNYFSGDIMLVVMFSERVRTTERNGNTEQLNPERLNMERQMKKLARFYAHSKDENPNDRGNYKSYMNYVFYSDKKGYGEDELTPDEARRAQKILVEDDNVENLERDLLRIIQGPIDQYGAGAVFNGMNDDKHQKRILGYMVRDKKGWELYNYTSRNDVENFIHQYPTPIDFENTREGFLKIIRAGNSQEKAQEYEDAMEEFQQRVYGKRYEYYKAMKELHKEAEETGTRRPNGGVGKIERIKSKFAEIFERDSVVKDAGLAMKNKNLTGGDEFWAQNPNRPNEDAAYYNPRIGMFGVFDGAGGVRNAALASQLGKDAVIREVSKRTPGTPDELKQILTVANGVVASEGGGGISTVVIGRILEKQGQKTLVWASAGDSRIYVVGKGTVKRITKDETLEGHPNVITNGLGTKSFQVEYAGKYKLNDGDRIVFCSDGVTGDRGKDIMQDDELARIVREALDADMAAQELIRRARKFDDRTAIVVEV